MIPRPLLLALILAASRLACAEPETAPQAYGSGASPASGSTVATAPGAAAAAVPAPATGSAAAAPDSASFGQRSMRAMDWAASQTQDLIATALSSIGVKYRRGASDPSVGFDCSGFVRHVYKEALGLLLPHNAYSMSLQGKPVPMAELKPGDLVFFNTLKRQFSHVGIYLGDDRFIHAPSHGKTVQVEKLSDGYWARHFTGARRIDGNGAQVSASSVSGAPEDE